jgi:hypothetical protein
MCVETKKIIKNQDVVFLEGRKEVKSVDDNKLFSKQVEHVITTRREIV